MKQIKQKPKSKVEIELYYSKLGVIEYKIVKNKAK